MRTDRCAAHVVAAALLVATAGLLAGCNDSLFVQNRSYEPYTAPGKYIPDDEYYDLQWHYDLIDVPGAWSIMREAGTPGGPPRTPQTVRVAVIDTGIREHEDLDPGPRVEEWDFFEDDNDATDDGPYSATAFHGMHVAGTLVAITGNDIGVAGIGDPDGPATLEAMPLRALGAPPGCTSPDCVQGSTDDIAAAILYAVGGDVSDHSGARPLTGAPAKVINLSLGGVVEDGDIKLYEAVQAAVDAGATVIAAAGNTLGGTDTTAGGVLAPARYDNTLAIAAVGPDGDRAPYSNIGPELDFAAPGGAGSEFVWSTSDVDCAVVGSDPRQPCDGAGDNIIDAYTGQQGTSMATPHVAGVVALLYSYAPELTQDEVYDILLATVDDAGEPGHDKYYGHGIINARAALEYLIRATDDYGVAPIGGDGGGADGDGAAGTGNSGSGPMGRPILQREGAFLPASTANVGIDYDAGSVVLALWEERLAPDEVAPARRGVAEAVEGVAEIVGEDPRRLRARLAPGADHVAVIRDLAARPEVRYAQPNYIYTVPTGVAPVTALPAAR
ncbi:MAG: S8 family serine peptidase [Spirochaetota bacterium]